MTLRPVEQRFQRADMLETNQEIMFPIRSRVYQL